MWNFLPSCLRRHRRKFFVLGGVIGGVVLLNSYLKKKFIEWETQKTADLCDQFKRSSHFDGTMATCDSALIRFAPKIKEIVCSKIDVNPLINQLQDRNPVNKVQLWEQIKVLVFTQVIGEMYAQCLLVVLLRVQMSILGGYIYCTSQTNNISPDSVADKHQKYMSQIADFLSKGISNLLVPIQKAVEDVINVVPLNQNLKLQDLADILSKIRLRISAGSMSPLPDVSSYLISSNGTSNDEFLEKISIETRDILECYDFDQVLNCSIDQGINSVMDKFSECFDMIIRSNNSEKEFRNPHDFQAPLAKIISKMHVVFNQYQPTEPTGLIHLLLQHETLKTFAANIYESFSQTKS